MTTKNKTTKRKNPQSKRPRLPLYFRTEASKAGVLKDADKYKMSGNDYCLLVLSYRKIINDMIDRGEITI